MTLRRHASQFSISAQSPSLPGRGFNVRLVFLVRTVPAVPARFAPSPQQLAGRVDGNWTLTSRAGGSLINTINVIAPTSISACGSSMIRVWAWRTINCSICGQAYQQSAAVALNLAQTAGLCRDYELRENAIKLLAIRGDAKAQRILGNLYFLGAKTIRKRYYYPDLGK